MEYAAPGVRTTIYGERSLRPAKHVERLPIDEPSITHGPFVMNRLAEAFELDWRAATPALTKATSVFIIGRGYGYGVAQEMALKLKETCALHAESFSAAEVRHGPMAIVRDGFPVLAIATSDPSGASVREVTTEIQSRGANVFLADTTDAAGLPAITAHLAIEPILMLASFYRFANDLALRRGLDPDEPPFLAKITQTV